MPLFTSLAPINQSYLAPNPLMSGTGAEVMYGEKGIRESSIGDWDLSEMHKILVMAVRYLYAEVSGIQSVPNKKITRETFRNKPNIAAQIRNN